MLEKGFLRNQANENPKHHRIALIASKMMLYLGTLIMVSTFIYLLVNWEKSNFLIGMLLPFLVTGLGLILVSQLIKRANNKLRK